MILADCGKIRLSQDGGEGHAEKVSTRTIRLKLEHLYTKKTTILCVADNSDQLCKLSQ